ncbi:MAG: DNA replication/repair protein RecF [Bacillota bacterium]
MYVKNLRLKDFRNYNSLNLSLDKKLNIIIGDNAQGKTNLLEAIYFACFGKSFRTNKNKDLIQIDKEFNYVKLEVKLKHIETKIEYRIHKNLKKQIKINNNSIKKLSDILGNINVVLFSPEDLELVKGSPGVRRNFINRELSNLYPKYCKKLIKYQKIRKQRNNLLKKYKMSNEHNKFNAHLEIFSKQLIDTGSYIIFKRYKFLKRLNKISKKIHMKLTDKNENLKLDYLSNINFDNNNLKEIKNNFKDELGKDQKREKKLGYTLSGPHRDDFSMLINNKDINKYGSQGQQRTTALSIKLSEINLIKEEIGEYPILLLDDVFSELDINRQKRLLEIFNKTQTIITSTHLDNILKDKVNKKNLIKVRKGKILGGK